MFNKVAWLWVLRLVWFPGLLIILFSLNDCIDGSSLEYVGGGIIKRFLVFTGWASIPILVDRLTQVSDR